MRFVGVRFIEPHARRGAINRAPTPIFSKTEGGQAPGTKLAPRIFQKRDDGPGRAPLQPTDFRAFRGKMGEGKAKFLIDNRLAILLYLS